MLVRRAFSLFELLLALGLSVFVLGIVGMAIDVNLRMLDSRRSGVEQSQIARAVLKHIATDLRSAVQYQPVDLSGIEEVASPDGAASLLESGAAGQLGIDPSTVEDAASSDLSVSTTPSVLPGLYGNQFEMHVDVARLPRLDEYSMFVQPDPSRSVTDIPSDVKTVAYFVQNSNVVEDELTDAIDLADEATSQTFGLVRRELDRAVTQWAYDNGNSQSISSAGDILAPEVEAIEFRYFDGTQWLLEWDSTEQESLPIAVEIVIALKSDDPITSNAPLQTGMLVESLLQNSNIYRYVVRLPAVPLPTDVTDEEDLSELGL